MVDIKKTDLTTSVVLLGKSVSVFHEPPIISRIVDYIAAPLRQVIGFGTPTSDNPADTYSNEIEMTTFSSSTGQSPPVQSGGCCTSAHASHFSSGKTNNPHNTNGDLGCRDAICDIKRCGLISHCYLHSEYSFISKLCCKKW